MTLTSVELAVGCNEASDLLPVLAPEVLAAHGARRAFWTVLDEGTVEQCLALLLERPDGTWTAHHAAFDAGLETGRTEDGEALARSGEWVYVLGSHFGSKGGPLRPKRAFFARFREADAGRPGAALYSGSGPGVAGPRPQDQSRNTVPRPGDPRPPPGSARRTHAWGAAGRPSSRNGSRAHRPTHRSGPAPRRPRYGRSPARRRTRRGARSRCRPGAPAAAPGTARPCPRRAPSRTPAARRAPPAPRARARAADRSPRCTRRRAPQRSGS